MNEALASFSYFLDVDKFAVDFGWSCEMVRGSASSRLFVSGHACVGAGAVVRSCAQ